MVCSHCSSPLPPNSLFCNRCGAKLSAEPPPPSGGAGRWVVVVAGAVLFTGALGSVLASGVLDQYIAKLEPDDAGLVSQDTPQPVSPQSAPPTSGKTATPASGTIDSPPTSGPVGSQPSSGPAPTENTPGDPSPTPNTPPPANAFTISLDSKPQGATVKDRDGVNLGQTPTSVVLPGDTIVELAHPDFEDTCRFALSSKLKDQTLKCSFRKPKPGAPTNPESVTPPTKTPTSSPSAKTNTGKTNTSKTNDKPKANDDLGDDPAPKPKPKPKPPSSSPSGTNRSDF